MNFLYAQNPRTTHIYTDIYATADMNEHEFFKHTKIRTSYYIAKRFN